MMFSTRRGGLFLLLFCIFRQTCLALNDLRIEPPTTDFVKVIENGDGNQEVIVSYGGILAFETVHGLGELFARQLTNGRDQLQLIYQGHGQLVACEFSNDPPEVPEFFQRYLTAEAGRRHENGNDLIGWEESDVGKMTEIHKEMANWKRNEAECKALQEKKRKLVKKNGMISEAESSSPARARRSLMFPGTTWCGMGNVSKDMDQADGVHGATDRCCRDHDLCQHTISGFSTKYGLFNFRFHTISHCECDDRFRTCLRMSSDENADFIGRLFFNIIGMKCFVLKPETACLERAWWGKCIRQGTQYKATTRDSVPYYVD